MSELVSERVDPSPDLTELSSKASAEIIIENYFSSAFKAIAHWTEYSVLIDSAFHFNDRLYQKHFRKNLSHLLDQHLNLFWQLYLKKCLSKKFKTWIKEKKEIYARKEVWSHLTFIKKTTIKKNPENNVSAKL